MSSFISPIVDARVNSWSLSGSVIERERLKIGGGAVRSDATLHQRVGNQVRKSRSATERDCDQWRSKAVNFYIDGDRREREGVGEDLVNKGPEQGRDDNFEGARYVKLKIAEGKLWGWHSQEGSSIVKKHGIHLGSLPCGEID